ncbi:rod shape-determining protein RodA [bacterium]|nr:rod shape-determining protein RodA [bacterium]|tara:strand:+ start:4154 stop:5287 length:1134 start_codon:yes stop_codon:yes gene_type:complete
MEIRKQIDWTLLISVVPLLGAGLVTMFSFSGGADIEGYFFSRQIIWIAISLLVFFLLSFVDFRFLRKSGVVLSIYLFFVLLLLFLLILTTAVRGAQSWFLIGDIIAFQPADFMKLALILILAKYFSRRHIEIAHIKHIIISGVYAFIPFVLIFLQPDFGSAMIIFLIWLGMIMVSGVSKKHLALVAFVAITSFLFLWGVALTDVQKTRISSFLDPLADLEGAGYNAYQSTIAVGSGGWFGKGVGYGTQSRLEFLPEYQTDFIFAAFAEEWGFVGVAILFILFVIVFWRILLNAYKGHTNFEMLFGLGLSIMLMSHFVIHVGMNIGLLPVTGLTVPFLSYGGSHLLATFVGLGILMGMRSYARVSHRDKLEGREFIGV